MDISSKEFLDTLPTTLRQGKESPADLMVYARLYHPDHQQDYYVLHRDTESEGFMTITKYDFYPDFSLYSYICIDSLLTAHSTPYLVDEDFVPVKVTELMPELRKKLQK